MPTMPKLHALPAEPPTKVQLRPNCVAAAAEKRTARAIGPPRVRQPGFMVPEPRRPPQLQQRPHSVPPRDDAAPTVEQPASPEVQASAPVSGSLPSSPATSQPPALVCTHSLGSTIAQMLLKDRCIMLPNTTDATPMVIGRLRQQNLFERLLRDAPEHLPCISRLHIEIAPAASGSGAYEVTNISTNAIQVGAVQVEKGDSTALQPGDHIEFITTAPDGVGVIPVLKFVLQTAPPRTASGTVEAAVATPDGGSFWLILGGSLVKEHHPPEELMLQGTGSSLTVGRTSQKALHRDALVANVVEYISREHFRVEYWPSEDNHRIVALGSNPIWVVHVGQRTEVTDPTILEHCDMILLFTGATDCTPDGPGSLGTLHWSFFSSRKRSAQQKKKKKKKKKKK
eukprot:NODE_8396_length_1498_cov_7.350839.p1 GENE.NODE_8396_length_1498_cov_7.350839~~NODE_8396_length_1498_cov_7.350839.p1  ORF type:complete len:454 (-),score=166.53 NODE_8396_length_1498_cov_7.350839:136-1329(-)